MKKIEDKIKGLEEKIRDDFEWGSTWLDPNCLTATEKKLFSHFYQMTLPTQFNPEDAELVNKITFFAVRRILDLFMRVMNLQLTKIDEKFVFWSRFIDFISETMYKINYNRGVDYGLKTMVGENVDEWPQDDDDIAWKKFEDWEKKWSKEFKQLWKEISPTAEKLFFQNSAVPPKEDEGNKEEDGIKMMEMFGEIISYCLTRPSLLDMYILAMASALNESEHLESTSKKIKR